MRALIQYIVDWTRRRVGELFNGAAATLLNGLGGGRYVCSMHAIGIRMQGWNSLSQTSFIQCKCHRPLHSHEDHDESLSWIFASSWQAWGIQEHIPSIEPHPRRLSDRHESPSCQEPCGEDILTYLSLSCTSSSVRFLMTGSPDVG